MFTIQPGTAAYNSAPAMEGLTDPWLNWCYEQQQQYPDCQAMDENGNLASLGKGKGPGPYGGKHGYKGFEGDQKGQSGNYEGQGKGKPGTEHYAGCHNCGSKEHMIRERPHPRPPNGSSKGSPQSFLKGGGKSWFNNAQTTYPNQQQQYGYGKENPQQYNFYFRQSPYAKGGKQSQYMRPTLGKHTESSFVSK